MEVAHPVMSRENFQSQDVIERDLTKVNTLSANQVGAEAEGDHSATEMTYVQRNADVRMQAEQPLTGYSYDIKPDSGMHVDAAADRKFALDRYNLLRKDDLVDANYLVTELAPALRLDPTRMLKPPPPPHPETPKTSVIVKGEDLSPLSPQYTNMVELLKQIGIQLTPTPITTELIQNAALSQPIAQPHGGSADRTEPVNKHGADETQAIPHFGGQAGGVQ